MFRLAVFDVDIILILGGLEVDSFGGMLSTKYCHHQQPILDTEVEFNN